MITGAGGMVGRDLVDELTARGEDLIALAKSDLDITNARGVAHYANEEECTWYDFACAIAEGSGVNVKPVSSDEFRRPATRPAYSVLSTERYERLTGVRPESWREGLREYLALRA